MKRKGDEADRRIKVAETVPTNEALASPDPDGTTPNCIEKSQGRTS